ncbi:flagellar hook-length control protein FliK [Arcobacter venerupis]|uniref:Flagellar hook-length control protein FliK n=1 Tax=Arcobacter venerupis TaxID=1054033 RepID=A0AAE7E5P7_9BACT|nr:flagellar hook-length control protein FliK [Arcobacter venerupis]QKF68051.1 flagellar hook-length control protein FliK [Arcobacter venerupis]RWS48805.1 hypothetical protein CKA56_11760 [Arcobacter venerupis]
MSNIIDNLLPTDKIVNTNTTSTTDQPLKDKPSLFDSLLLNSMPKDESNVDTKTTVISEIKKEDVVTTLNNIETTEDVALPEEDISSTDKEQKVSTSSLLDRLIIEAKKGAKEASNTNENIDIRNEKTDTKNGKTDSTLLNNIETTVDGNIKEVKKDESNDLKTADLTDDTKTTTTKMLDDTLTNKLNTDIQDTSNLININAKDNSLDSENKLNQDTSELVLSEIEKPLETKNKVVENTLEIITPKLESNSNKSIEQKIDVKENSEKKITKEITIDSSLNKINNNDTSIINESKLVNNGKDLLSNNIVDNNSIEVEISTENITNNIDLSNEKESLNSTVLVDSDLENSSILPDESLVIEDVNKNSSELVSNTKDQKMSLMDQLILKNSAKITLNMTTNDINPTEQEIAGKDFISSLYLGSQKNKINNQSLFNKNEAVTLLKDGTSIDAVKTSAEMLDLGLEGIDVDKDIEIEKVEVKTINLKTENKKDFIDNILLDKNIKSDDIKGLITKSVEASAALLENTINLADDAIINVNSPLSFNIQSKIIGARQQMATMMSDIAKQMYENYKPPVTAFRINLNPTTLGSIAILMKSDKSNGLSISLSASSNSTLDALVENQNVLKNSLNKTFNESTEFNLDFSSSNQNSNNQSSFNNQSGQGQNPRKIEQQMDTQSILQLKEENKDREEKSIDYM